MPFDKPSAGGSVFETEDGRYLLKVADLEDTESGEYGPGIKWVLNVATMDRQMIKDERGFDAQFWQFSSAKLTPRAKGRKWVEAFLGRELDETNDDGPALMKELKGKWAIGLLAHNDKDRVAIVTLSPLKTGAKQPVGAASKSNGTQATVPVMPDDPADDVLAEIDADADIPFA